MKLPSSTIQTPIGTLRIITHDGKVCAAEWDDHWERVEGGLQKRFGIIEPVRSKEADNAARILDAYFHGELGGIDMLPVDAGGTAFQQAVWKELRKIRPGTTISYAELAERIGKPGASRAVGSANGSNPVAVVVPCHRVIRTGGALGGYGGGLHRKEWLLRHEGKLL